MTLVFATGFTFAADVTIVVNNPSDTCVLDSGVPSDAGADSGILDATSN